MECFGSLNSNKLSPWCLQLCHHWILLWCHSWRSKTTTDSNNFVRVNITSVAENAISSVQNLDGRSRSVLICSFYLRWAKPAFIISNFICSHKTTAHILYFLNHHEIYYILHFHLGPFIRCIWNCCRRRKYFVCQEWRWFYSWIEVWQVHEGIQVQILQGQGQGQVQILLGQVQSLQGTSSSKQYIAAAIHITHVQHEGTHQVFEGTYLQHEGTAQHPRFSKPLKSTKSTKATKAPTS